MRAKAVYNKFKLFLISHPLMIHFLKNFWILVLAALLAIALIVAWFKFPSIRDAACGFALAAFIIIGVASAVNIYRTIYRE